MSKTKNFTPRLDWVDSLRGWAILGVILIHSTASGINLNLFEPVHKFINAGARGVQLFFLISAFTIFLNQYHHMRKEKNSVMNFFIRRFFRIAPLYWMAIIYFLIQDGFGPRYWLGDTPNITALNIIFNFLFLHSLNPYWINSIVPAGWSISVEIIFYLVVPFLIKTVTSLSKAFVFLITSLIFSKLLFLQLEKMIALLNLSPKDSELFNIYLWFYPPSQLVPFAMGIILFYIFIRRKKWGAGTSSTILISGLTFLMYCVFKDTGTKTILYYSISFLMIAIGMSKIKVKILENSLLIFIGKISYSLYICHFGIIHWYRHLNIDNLIPVIFKVNPYIYILMNFLTILFLCSSVAVILYILIEKPMINYAKKLVKKLESS